MWRLVTAAWLTMWLGAAVAALVFVMATPRSSIPADATPIDPADDLSDQTLNPDRLPTVYTGELVDLDGDEVPDVALFGDPRTPVVRALSPEADSPWSAVIAVVGIVAALVGTMTSPIVAAWARRRFGQSQPVDEIDEVAGSGSG